MILSTHGIVGSQIQSFVGLLDDYPSAAAAYSVRKLRSAYTGSAIRVRRASDNAEQNIGFQADMSHTLLYTMGYNCPEDRILPVDYNWEDREVLKAWFAVACQ